MCWLAVSELRSNRSLCRLVVRNSNGVGHPTLSLGRGMMVLEHLREVNYTLTYCPFEVQCTSSDADASTNDFRIELGHSKIAELVVSASQTLLALNGVGRGEIIGDEDATRGDWVELLVTARNDLDTLWYLLLLKPGLFFNIAHVSSARRRMRGGG